MRTKLKLVLTATLALAITLNAAQPSTTFTDPRNNKTYKTVKIVKQTWMVENLNIKIGASWCYGN